jgi:hypothetical protein
LLADFNGPSGSEKNMLGVETNAARVDTERTSLAMA